MHAPGSQFLNPNFAKNLKILAKGERRRRSHRMPENPKKIELPAN